MIRLIATLLALVLATGSGATAHAFLERARPAVGSQVRTAPQAVSITFTEGVEPRFSRIEVRDGQGVRVDTGELRSGSDGRMLAVAVSPLSPGRYAVEWHVVSVDTHRSEGSFDFTVAP
jgi:methionine-rich copper-binding protein CopC